MKAAFVLPHQVIKIVRERMEIGVLTPKRRWQILIAIFLLDLANGSKFPSTYEDATPFVSKIV